MGRSRVRNFSFSLPLTKINKSDGLFSVTSAGELLVTAKALIAPELNDLPLEFANNSEVRISIESVTYQGVDIRPIFDLPDAKPLFHSIQRAAYNSLISIENSE